MYVCCICRGYIPHIHPLFDYKLESECIYDVNLHPNWCSLSSGNDVVLKCISSTSSRFCDDWDV